MKLAESNYWGTPDYIFDPLNEIFDFDVDVCATSKNTKCDFYINEEMNAHKTHWGQMNWCNPPYGRGLTLPFVENAIFWNEEYGDRTIMLHKCDPSTKVFQMTWCYTHLFYYKRVKFVGSDNAANFPVNLTFFGDLTESEINKLEKLNIGKLI